MRICTKRKWWMVMAADSHGVAVMRVLHHTVDLIQHLLESLMGSVMPSDYYFSATIHSNPKGDVEQRKSDCRCQETKVKDKGTQGAFSSVLQVNRKGLVGVNILRVTSWLWGWCHKQYFYFYDHVVNSLLPGRGSSQRKKQVTAKIYQSAFH